MNKFCIADIDISGFKKSLVYDGEFPATVNEFKSWVIRKHFPQLRNSVAVEEEFYVLSQTRIQHDEDFICDGQTYHFLPRLVGGKGGFGSMLRAIGAQIEKTTNREACRDLSGRRMRDINNEKQLKDWMSKQKDRDKERIRRREEKAARRRAEPQHKFEDKLYNQQREKVSRDLDDAFQQGLKRTQASATTSSNATVTSAKKKKVEDSLQKQWNLMGVTEDDSSLSSNSDVSDDDVTGGACAFPGIPTPTSDAGDSAGASTSAASDHEFCPPLLPIEHTDSDSQSSSLGSLPSGSTKVHSLSKCESNSSAGSEPSSSLNTNENITEENTQDLTTVLENANCAKDLECVGLEKLKAALIDKGLKCGGTLAERAQRLFAVRGLPLEQIDPSFFAKSSKGKGPKKNN